MKITCCGEDGRSEEPPKIDSTVPAAAVADQATVFTLCLSMKPAYPEASD